MEEAVTTIPQPGETIELGGKVGRIIRVGKRHGVYAVLIKWSDGTRSIETADRLKTEGRIMFNAKKFKKELNEELITDDKKFDRAKAYVRKVSPPNAKAYAKRYLDFSYLYSKGHTAGKNKEPDPDDHGISWRAASIIRLNIDMWLGEAVRPSFTRDRYDRLASEFSKKTGMMAPGKDRPAAMGSPGYSDEERDKAWKEFLRGKGYSMEAFKPTKITQKPKYTGAGPQAQARTQFRPGAPSVAGVQSRVAAAASKRIKPKKEGLTEEGTADQLRGKIYDHIKAAEEQLSRARKIVGRRPRPGEVYFDKAGAKTVIHFVKSAQIHLKLAEVTANNAILSKVV
jgi:hypothetical protein